MRGVETPFDKGKGVEADQERRKGIASALKESAGKELFTFLLKTISLDLQSFFSIVMILC